MQYQVTAHNCYSKWWSY